MQQWEQNVAPKIVDTCADEQTPFLWEDESGDVYTGCITTGTFYMPPFHLGALADLLWPDAWGPAPPL